jgi:putative polyketide hydroxylase
MEEVMQCTSEARVPVVIVGAGPAGLMTAVTLAEHGVESLLVERRRELSSLPRATVISLRSMEMLRAWGLEQEVRDGGVEVDWLEWNSETLAQAGDGSGIPVGYPTRAQSAALSPTSPACVPQDHLEPVLLRHLQSLGTSRVRLGTEFVRIDDGPDGVDVVLRDVESGASSVVRADYVVAADGAHSKVRAALDIPMQGEEPLFQAVTALFRAPLWDLLGDLRYGLFFVSRPDARGLFLPAGTDDRWLYGSLSARDLGASLDEFTEEEFMRLIRLGAGIPHLEPRIERIGSFAFSAKLAERFRQGRTFLVGDAAHRVTPRGGTGMNTAMHDGFDLGWKLAWVLRGWGDAALLDTYEEDRRPIVEHNLARSIDPDGSEREVAQELHADLGGRIPHVWLPSADGLVSTLDLVRPGLTLFTGPERTHWDDAAAAISTLPLVVQSLDPSIARALGIRHGGALLVRPDGVPTGWWGDGADAAHSLRAAVRSAGAGTDHLAAYDSDRAAA